MEDHQTKRLSLFLGDDGTETSPVPNSCETEALTDPIDRGNNFQ